MMKLQSVILILLFSFTPLALLAKTTIKVGYLPLLDHLPLLVSYAQKKDAFQYVHLELKISNTWDKLAEDLKAGTIDAAFILSPLAMDLFSQGLPIHAILLGHRNGSAITVRKELAIHSPMDLKGKKIALPHAQSTHLVLLNKYLTDAGLSLKEVMTQVISPTKIFGALLTGEIDGFMVAEPFGARAQIHNIGKILVLSKNILNQHIDCILVIHQKVIKAAPQAIQEWLDSLIQAGQWIEQDKLKGSQGVAQLIAYEYLPYSEATLITALQNPLDRITFNDLNPRMDDFKKMMELSIRTGILNPVNLKNFVNNQFYLKSQKK